MIRPRRASLLPPLALALALAGCGAASEPVAAPCPPAPAPDVAPAPTPALPGAAGEAAPPTKEEARRFLDGIDTELRKLWTAQQRAAWINLTYINGDTEIVSAAADEAVLEFLNRAQKAAVRFDALELPPDQERQLHLLKISATVPAPSDPKERAELAGLGVSMAGMYGKGKYCPPHKLGKADPKAATEEGRCLDLGQLSNILSKSRKADELREAWTGWHGISPPIRAKYERYVELGNKGAREVGFKDLSALWKAGYDMPPDVFEADTERLWGKVKPLYDELHCYVRARLRDHYGKDLIGEKAPIPAHLLGNMWAQEWGNIYPLVEPYKGQASLDVTRSLEAKKYDEVKMVKLGEAFFTSLGFEALPPTFWERSLLKKPKDREVVCHASAWDVTFSNDLRIKMCVEITESDLVTIHHELGHNYYYNSYYKLPILFQQGANDGFHEGIGDTLALSVTPAYLKGLGLLERVPDNPKAEINFLLKNALDKVAFLPFGKMIDQWRWDVFSGKTPPSQYNKAWWDLRRRYQGIVPPVERSEKDFDAGAKYHVPANVPYTRYFLARIYQFQFHRALCKAAGHTGPLTTCSIHGSKAAGAKLKAMLEMGASKPWPEAMRAISGETEADPGALLEYFEPLRKWLREQNKNEVCGW